MSLTPFLTAPTDIQLHIVAAVLALVVGPFALFGRRRGRMHRSLGYVWVVAMTTTAMASFWIGAFGPLHLLACLALWSVGLAMWHVWNGRYADHAAVMQSLYWRGLLIAGLFTLMPGRTMNRIVFGEPSGAGWLVIGLGLGAILLHALRGIGRTGANA